MKEKVKWTISFYCYDVFFYNVTRVYFQRCLTKKMDLLFELKVLFTFIWNFNGTILKERDFQTGKEIIVLRKEKSFIKQFLHCLEP